MSGRAKGRDERGLRGGWKRFQRHHFAEPSADLAPLVSHYWAASWDLRGEQPYRQLIVPYPNVHLSFLNGVARVRGVARGHVVRVLEDQGWVFGVAFRPGCFRPFLGAAVAAIVEDFLRAELPAPDPMTETVAGIVERVATEPDITRVDRLAETVHTSVRRLQRLFAEYVGVGPKWVIRRYRLDEVTKRMAAGDAVDWAGLAAELGYADQAHFTRDFTAMVGETPAQYAARY